MVAASVALLAGVLVAPAGADAATVSVGQSGGVSYLLLNDNAGEPNNLVIDDDPIDPSIYTLTDSSSSLSAGAGCAGGGAAVSCQAAPGFPLVQMDLNLGAGDDSLVANTRILSGRPPSYTHAVKAGDGADTITINAGTWGSVDAGPGDDQVDASSSSEGVLINGDAGDDTLIGSDFADTISDLILESGSGDDTITGLGGADVVHGGPNNDTIDLGAGDDAGRGNGGADLILGAAGDDVIYGGWDSPGLTGDLADELHGGGGNDRLQGYDGADTLFGEDGDDFLITGLYFGTFDGIGGSNPRYAWAGTTDAADGGPGNDDLLGDDGDDQLSGSDGNDRFAGGKENDHLAGGAGSDQLDGEAGDDTLQGGADTDTFVGGTGIDTADYSDRTGSVNVTLGAIAGDDGETGEGETLGSDLEGVVTGSGDDSLDGTAVRNNVFQSGAGADALFELDGETASTASTIDCGAGEDTLIEVDPTDHLTGCEGDGGGGGGNQLPVAVIDLTDLGDGCYSFDGSQSYDPDGGTITGFSWQIGGVEVAAGPTYSDCFSEATVVRLFVTDDEASQDSEDVAVIAGSGPQPMMIDQLLPPSGRSGDTVQVDGSNFCDADPNTLENQVYFSQNGQVPGIAAAVSAESDSRITVVAPAGLTPSTTATVTVYCQTHPVSPNSNSVPWEVLADPVDHPDPPDPTEPHDPTPDEVGNLRPQANIIIAPTAKRGRFVLDSRASMDADGGSIVAQRWMIGSKTISTKPVLTKSFAKKTRVRLVVTDDEGSTHRWGLRVRPTSKHPFSRINVVGFFETAPGPAQIKAIKAVRPYIKKFDEKARVNGYTDTLTGDSESNMAQAGERATDVRKILTKGVKRPRVSLRALGSERPMIQELGEPDLVSRLRAMVLNNRAECKLRLKLAGGK